MGSTWANHGTKILGFVVAVIGAMGDVQQLFAAYDSNPKHIALYTLVAALGGAIVKRGFTNTQNQPPAEPPSLPDKEKGFIDREVLVALAVFMLCLVGCSLLANQPLDAKIGTAKETVASVERAAAAAVNAGTLNVATGQEIYTDSQSVVKYLDAAHAAIVAGNNSEGAAQYQLANGLLSSLQTYLNAHLPQGQK